MTPVTLRTVSSATLRGTLVADEPLHMGSGTGRPGVDLTIQRDGLGRPIIPGTGLAGVLRDALEPQLGERVETAFGDPSLTIGASRVLIEDAPLTDSPEVREVRPSTGVDRRTGAGDAGVLFTRESLVAGSLFAVEITVERGPDEAGPDVLDLIVQALQSGIKVGAATTRGLGGIRLIRGTVTRCDDLDTPAGVFARLRGGTSEAVANPGPGQLPPTALRLTIGWHPTGTIMCGVDTDVVVGVRPRTATELVPEEKKGNRSTQYRQQIQLVLPGSGIKGALSSRAELIAKTVAERAIPPLPDRDGRAASGRADFPVLRNLFGAPGRSTPEGQQGQRGAVATRDCRSTTALPTAEWNKVIWFAPTNPGTNPSVADEAYSAAVADLNAETPGQRFEVIDRVAVDRWTGGAASGLLFAALEPTAGTWEDIVLDVDLRRVPEGDARKDAIALLLLTVRDVERGLVPLGRGTLRGWGQVVVDSVTLQVGSDITELTGVAESVLHDSAVVPALVEGWYARATGGTP